MQVMASLVESIELMSCRTGAIQVLRDADGGGGFQFLRKKALRRCKVPLLALRNGPTAEDAYISRNNCEAE